MNRRLFIITGDPSGDYHAANVVRALRALDDTVEVAAVGGNKLKEAGVALLEDQSQMGRVGLGSVWGAPYHYFLGRKILKFLKNFQPSVVLLIDYGVFNLWMARQLKKLGIPVCYFIPPQVWASRRGRIKKIQQNVDHVFCIFPFEEPLYQKEGIPVTFVGHPLIGKLPPPAYRQAFCQKHGLDSDKPVIGLFPGSRKMEIDYLLEPLLASVPKIKALEPDTQFVLAKADALKQDYFQNRFKNASVGLEGVSVTVVENENHALLSVADAVIVASGTVTLEAALYETPMVLIYKGHPLIYQIAIRLCYLPCIGLPNILTDMQNPIVPELWQDAVHPERISQAIRPFLNRESPEYQRAMAGFQSIRQTLGSKNAPEAVAEALYQVIGKSAVMAGPSSPEPAAG